MDGSLERPASAGCISKVQRSFDTSRLEDELLRRIYELVVPAISQDLSARREDSCRSRWRNSNKQVQRAIGA